MQNVNLECTIYYDVLERECFAVMDELRIESGLYAGTVFVVVMDRFGGHEMVHESHMKAGNVKIEKFTCYDAHQIRRVLLELSFVNDLKTKKQFVQSYQLLNF